MRTQTAEGHTPTPWRISSVTSRYIESHDGEIIGTAYPETMMDDYPVACANAAFIVKAVNCHEELLEACKQMRDMLLSCGYEIHNPTIKLAKEAITKAEA